MVPRVWCRYNHVDAAGTIVYGVDEKGRWKINKGESKEEETEVDVGVAASGRASSPPHGPQQLSWNQSDFFRVEHL